MTAQELYRAGELSAAIQTLGDELKKNPLDAKRRTFLFELLLFAGELGRAEKQLDVLASAGGTASGGALVYLSALHAERTRTAMFQSGEFPQRKDGYAPTPGSANGKPFAEIEDADPRIGANLEVFIAGSYTWIPMVYMRSLTIEKPEKLRDLMWARAQLETSPAFRLQDLGEVLLPAISPLSFTHPDQPVRLGREISWEPDARYGELPFGPKVMLIDGEEIPLLELREIEWTAADGEESAEAKDASA
jgi:type VI secretion system protein ImpE